MKIKELREKNDVEIDRMLAELRDKLRDMRFKTAARQQGRVRDIRETRKTVAKLLTLKRQRQAQKAKA